MITGFLESPITEVAWSEKGGGFLEVVGNALIKNTLFKNEDLEKLLKVMMLSLWHKNAHHNYDELKFKLQSFGILVYDVELEFWQIVNVVISVKRFKVDLSKLTTLKVLKPIDINVPPSTPPYC
ncbi:8867_t:CDS:2 [Entrophospora sp. SA101]|nr:8867_t:CDS:2 [Entrophospora sp. SA101]